MAQTKFWSQKHKIKYHLETFFCINSTFLCDINRWIRSFFGLVDWMSLGRSGTLLKLMILDIANRFLFCTNTVIMLMWTITEGNRTQDSGLRTGLFNTKLHLEILHQDYIAKQYLHFEQIWTWHNKKCRNACWETSTKVIADRLPRGHPGRGGVLHSVVGIWK